MTEVFFLQMEGGPEPGILIVDDTQFPWPLPGFLMASGARDGRYVKVSESAAPPPAGGSKLLRSARYEWRVMEPEIGWRSPECDIEEAGSATAQDG